MKTFAMERESSAALSSPPVSVSVMGVRANFARFDETISCGSPTAEVDLLPVYGVTPSDRERTPPPARSILGTL